MAKAELKTVEDVRLMLKGIPTNEGTNTPTGPSVAPTEASENIPEDALTATVETVETVELPPAEVAEDTDAKQRKGKKGG